MFSTGIATFRAWLFKNAGFSAALAVLICVAIVAGLSLFGYFPYLARYFGIGSAALAVVAGLAGVLAKTRNTEGALVRWGWLAVAGVLTAFVLSVSKEVSSWRSASAGVEAALAADRDEARRGGMQLTIAFRLDTILTMEERQALVEVPPVVGLLGPFDQVWNWYVSSCYEGFPSPAASADPLRELLSSQAFLVVLNSSQGLNDRLAKSEGFEAASALATGLGVIDIPSAIVQTSLERQARSCRIGYRTDLTTISGHGSDGDIIEFSLLLPPVENWFGSDGVSSIFSGDEPVRLTLASTAFRDTVHVPFDKWSIERVHLELPSGGFLCVTNAGTPTKYMDNWGLIAVDLNRSPDRTCRG